MCFKRMNAALVGTINWIALRTRPDIAWATSRAASLISRDTEAAFIRLKHICQYLRATIGFNIKFQPLQPTQKNLIWTCGDASFAPDGCASHQGIVIIHGTTSRDPKQGNIVHWKSNRQSLITKSTCEAELIASSEAMEQALNVSLALAELTRKSIEYDLSTDNSAALTLMRTGFEASYRTRHISVKGFWIYQMTTRGVQLHYTPTHDMIADSLTKGMGASRLPAIQSNLRLGDL